MMAAAVLAAPADQRKSDSISRSRSGWRRWDVAEHNGIRQPSSARKRPGLELADDAEGLALTFAQGVAPIPGRRGGRPEDPEANATSFRFVKHRIV